LTYTNGADVWFNKLHGIVNRQSRGNAATGGVNIQRNVFAWIFAFQEEHLRNNKICHVIFNRANSKDNIILEQS
jgi:hypothetical protein